MLSVQVPTQEVSPPTSCAAPQIQRGKLHGSIDVGLSVMSVKKRARRIDLDTEEHIYHLKVRGVRLDEVRPAPPSHAHSRKPGRTGFRYWLVQIESKSNPVRVNHSSVKWLGLRPGELQGYELG